MLLNYLIDPYFSRVFFFLHSQNDFNFDVMLPQHFMPKFVGRKSRFITKYYLNLNFDFIIIWATSWESLFMPYANNKCADQLRIRAVW